MKIELKNLNYVQFGCGHCAPDGWINYDSSPTLRFERFPLLGRLYTKNAVRFPVTVTYGDIVAGLPLLNSSCSGVYASHILEHLSLADLRTALRETRRILVPAGIFRLVVPDLEALATEYVHASDSGAALRFMRASGLGREHRSRGILGFLKSWLGNSEHLWMWDYKSLAAELEEAGFSSIRPCVFNDSSDDMFKLVENAERFEGALAIEALRRDD
jgi:SAM-dependent methyltransferase